MTHCNSLLRGAFILGALAATSLAAAQLGTGINYQGRLTDGGAPANGTHSFRFRLVADADGTTQVGPVVDVPNLNVSAGLFNVPLDFGAGAFDGQERWLEMSVKTGGPGAAHDYVKLNPQPLPPGGSSQFARLAGDVLDGAITAPKLAPLAITSGTLADGAVTSAKLGAGSVGSSQIADGAITAADIGNNQVVKSLNINGSGNLRDTLNLIAGANVTLTPSGNDVTISSAGPGGAGIWTAPGGGNIYYNGGNVGIGTASPQARLDVLGNWSGEQGAIQLRGDKPTLRFTGNAVSGDQSWIIHLGSDGPGNLQFFRRTGPDAWANVVSLVASNGNVGVGAANPLSKMEVIGATSQTAVLGYSSGAIGVFGRSTSFTGVHGETTSAAAAAVVGVNLHAGGGQGVFGESLGAGVGVYGKSAQYNGVRGEGNNANHAAVVGVHNNGGWGMYGLSSGNGVVGDSTAAGAGVFGRSAAWDGVHGETSVSTASGVAGVNLNTTGGFGVYGESRGGGVGVWGKSASFEGVHGESGSAVSAGVAGINTTTGIGVYGRSLGGGYAGAFDGKVRVSVLEITGGADLAEPFPMKEEQIDQGSVVVIDKEHAGRLRMSTHAYDKRVAGIVSGANGINPGISLTQEGAMEQGQNVALTGRVYVKADASFGEIEPGDLLTTSDTPGHCMKVAEHSKAQGAILGKAMSALKDGQGMVLVLVTLQ